MPGDVQGKRCFSNGHKPYFTPSKSPACRPDVRICLLPESPELEAHLVVCGFAEGLRPCRAQSCSSGEGLASGAGIDGPGGDVPHLHRALASAADRVVVDVP